MNMEHITGEELSELSHKDQVRFALFCAYQLKDNWLRKDYCEKAINVVELWLEDKATTEDCVRAISDFWPRAHGVNTCVLYAIATTHSNQYTSWVSTSDNASLASKFAIHLTLDLIAKEFVIKDQRDYYIELRYIDEIFEDVVLEGNGP
jgi:hypothetical protein